MKSLILTMVQSAVFHPVDGMAGLKDRHKVDGDPVLLKIFFPLRKTWAELPPPSGTVI